jgi:hypothetical protein
MSIQPIIKIGIINYDDRIIITDETGDYNSIYNTTGWGSPNYTRTTPYVTSINLKIYLPGSTTILSTTPLLATTFFGTDRAYNLTSLVTLQDGIWRYIVETTIDGILQPKEKYSLRDNDLVCAIGKLALSDMETNNYAEVKLMYDRMVQAFECEDYTLAQDLFDEITLMLSDSDCNSWSIGSSCGC